MKVVSTGYKNQIKEMGREIDSIITYYNHYKMITENNRYILTENGVKINTEQINNDNSVEITAEDIYSVKVITHGALLKTMMKELDFEVKQEMKIGSIVNYKFGLKVNGEYEYVDYGNFIVQEKEYNEDTQNYSYKAYDIMLKSMIPYKDTSTYPTTLYGLLNNVLEYCGISIGVTEFPNYERDIYNNVFEGLNITCRDVLDFITEVTGYSSYIYNDQFVIKGPEETKSNNLYDYKDVSQQSSGIIVDNDGWITISKDNTSGTSISYINYWTKPINVKPSTDYLLIMEVKNVSGNGRIVPSSMAGTSSQFNTTSKYFYEIENNKTYTFTITSVSNLDSTSYGLRSFAQFNAGQSGSITFRLSVLEDTSITVDTFKYEAYDDLYYLYEDSFKDTNVKFNKIYGPINSILFSRSEDTDIVEIKDDTSIEQNGVTQIKIKDNPLLEGTDRNDYFEEMFEVLDGLTYTLNDLSSTGITYLDYYDKYKIQIGDNTYQCLLLNDEINVEQGLEEQIFTEAPEETEQEYKTSRISDKDQKWANIQVKKDLGEITLEVGQLNEEVDGKVGNNEIISKINLSPESATIQSQKIDLQGYVTVSDLAGTGTTTINGSNITTGTISANRVSGGTLEGSNIKCGNNFSVDTTGKVTSKDIDITGGSIVLTRNATGQGIPFTIEQTAGGHTYKVQIGAGAFTYYRDGTSLGYFSAGASNYSHMSLTNAGTRTIYLNGNNGNITCVSLTQTSKEEEKKNFEKLENALDIVKDVDIYEYNLKNEKDKDKKHIGFVIGNNFNYREEITSENNDGVDTYSMVSVLWQAVKEQQEQIEELRKLVNK